MIPYVLLGLAALASAGIWLFELPGRKVCLIVLLLCASWSRCQWEEQHNVSNLLPSGMTAAEADGTEVFVTGTIASSVETDGDRVSFTLETAEIESADWMENASASTRRTGEQVKVSVRLLAQQEQAVAAGWQRGDQAAFTGTLRLPSEARNFGGFDYRAYLRLQHIHWMISVKGAEGLHVSAPAGWSPGLVLRWNDQLRSKLGSKLDELFPGTQGGYMKSLLLGIREDLNADQFKQFSELGLTHLLAISGMHVAVLVGVLMWVMRRLGLTKETNLLICICLIPGYVLLTGASPSIVRAGIMGMLGLMLARRNKLKDGQQIIGAAALAMLVWEPYYLLDVGFQLSFLVTWGLIIGVQKIALLLPAKPAWLNGMLTVSITAQLVSFPITVYYFNQLPLLSLPANLLLVPLIGSVVTPLGSVALIVGLVAQPPARWLAWLTRWLNEISFWLIDFMNRGASSLRLIWPKPSLWWVAAIYASGSWLIYLCWKRQMVSREQQSGVMLHIEPADGIRWNKLQPFLVALLLLVLLLYGYKPLAWSGHSTGFVSFLDVGQGDAALIQTPEHRFVLSDGGGTVTFRKAGEEWKERRDPYEVGRKLLVPLLKQRGVARLDSVIISHEDADHIGGLQAVLEDIPVDRILFNGTIKTSEGAKKLFRTALSKGIPLIPVHEGQSFRLDRDTVMTILSPARPDQGQPAELRTENEQNDHMVVFHLRMLDSTFLFTGDIHANAEREVLEKLEKDALSITSGTGTSSSSPKQLDVLKVAHHGSKTSSSEEWLSLWQPKYAVISVGLNNMYKHPSGDVVKRLSEHGTSILRTDLNGEVRIRVSKDKLDVETKLSP